MILITFGFFQNPLISPKIKKSLEIADSHKNDEVGDNLFVGDIFEMSTTSSPNSVTNIEVIKLTCFPFRGTQVSEQDVHNVHIDQLAANFSSVHFRILSLTVASSFWRRFTDYPLTKFLGTYTSCSRDRCTFLDGWPHSFVNIQIVTYLKTLFLIWIPHVTPTYIVFRHPTIFVIYRLPLKKLEFLSFFHLVFK